MNTGGPQTGGITTIMIGRLALLIALIAVVLPVTMAGPTSLRFFSTNRTDSVNDHDWQRWKVKFGRQYSAEEEQHRHKVFRDNMAYILKHNEGYPKVHSFKMGLNHFSDMTLEEFKAYNRLIPRGGDDDHEQADNHTFHEASPHLFLPKTLDWRDEGYVTPVKNQGACGSCYTFSAVVAIEGQYFKQTGKLVEFSEQQILDCSRVEGNQGCNGGLQTYSYDYVIDEPIGLMPEEDYPYTAEQGTCEARVILEVARVEDYKKVRKAEHMLQKALATVGPVASSMHAGLRSFQFYESGIFSARRCKNRRRQLDHAVATVGYGVTADKSQRPFWIVKNSWGTDWGEDGYFRIARNRNNMCGIATDNSYPIMPEQ